MFAFNIQATLHNLVRLFCLMKLNTISVLRKKIKFVNFFSGSYKVYFIKGGTSKNILKVKKKCTFFEVVIYLNDHSKL